jgi:hypothetical protein
MCVCTYMYVCAYKCVRACTCIYIYECVRLHVCACGVRLESMRIHICACVCVHKCASLLMRVSRFVNVHA